MNEREALERLGLIHDIAPDYYDIWGRHHRVSDASLAALLAALGVRARTPQMVVSRICDPAGVSLAHAQYGREQLIVANLDLRHKGGGFLQSQRKDLLKLVAMKKL